MSGSRIALAPIMVLVAPWWRCSWLAAPGSPQRDVPPARSTPPPTPSLDRKTTDRPIKRETLDGHRPPVSPITLPDGVVMRAIEPLRPVFVRCFKRAVDADPTVVSFKVRLRLEVNAEGVVTKASSDSDDARLAACLIRIGRGVRFPAPNRPAVVDFPLIYRA